MATHWSSAPQCPTCFHPVACPPPPQVQHGAGLAAAVALLRDVPPLPGPSEAHSEVPGVAAQRGPGPRLPAAAAELPQVSSANTLTATCLHESQSHVYTMKGV